jgi:hypothetical protein
VVARPGARLRSRALEAEVTGFQGWDRDQRDPNDTGLLPLGATMGSVAVVGPCADDPLALAHLLLLPEPCPAPATLRSIPRSM